MTFLPLVRYPELSILLYPIFPPSQVGNEFRFSSHRWNPSCHRTGQLEWIHHPLPSSLFCSRLLRMTPLCLGLGILWVVSTDFITLLPRPCLKAIAWSQYVVKYIMHSTTERRSHSVWTNHHLLALVTYAVCWVQLTRLWLC